MCSSDLNIVAFDKTGTLTVGRPELLQCVSVPGVARVRLLEMVTRVQAQSEHPLARALRTLPGVSEGPAPTVLETRAVAGRGVIARVQAQPGSPELDVLIGNARLMTEHAIDLSMLQEAAARLEGAGRTVS